jgi:hypothetical protein
VTYLLLVGAVLLLGSIGAFFLYVPLLTVASIVVILLGMAIMFFIGARVGGRQSLKLRLIQNESADCDVKVAPALAVPRDE